MSSRAGWRTYAGPSWSWGRMLDRPGIDSSMLVYMDKREREEQEIHTGLLIRWRKLKYSLVIDEMMYSDSSCIVGKWLLYSGNFWRLASLCVPLYVPWQIYLLLQNIWWICTISLFYAFISDHKYLQKLVSLFFFEVLRRDLKHKKKILASFPKL